jgi:hypothetical protein
LYFISNTFTGTVGAGPEKLMVPSMQLGVVTVNTKTAVAGVQLPLVTVYEMIVVPTVSALTIPDALIVATAGLLLAHTPPATVLV